jgi:hypothetical protein
LWRTLQNKPPQFLCHSNQAQLETLIFQTGHALNRLSFRTGVKPGEEPAFSLDESQSISGNCASIVRACDLMYWL